MCIDFETTNIEGIFKAAPYLKDLFKVNDKALQIFADGYGLFLFEDEHEMINAYTRTVGDDGPTELNDYDGSTRIYAITCDPNGNLMDENT